MTIKEMAISNLEYDATEGPEVSFALVAEAAGWDVRINEAKTGTGTAVIVTTAQLGDTEVMLYKPKGRGVRAELYKLGGLKDEGIASDALRWLLDERNR